MFYATINGVAPPYAQDGHWYLSKNPPTYAPTALVTKSNTILGMRYCPQDYQSKPYTANMSFECGQGPPQGNPQPPQPKPCCDTYKWTTPTNDSVWMTNIGRNDGQPIYQGVDKGVTKTIWFEFDRPGSLSGPGAWYVSDRGLKGMPKTQSATIQINSQSNVCPADNEAAFWEFWNTMTCAHFVAETCKDTKDASTLTNVGSGSSVSHEQCNIAQVMRQLVDKQMNAFVSILEKLPNSSRQDKHGNVLLPWEIRRDFENAATAWQAMVSRSGNKHPITGVDPGVCGFTGTFIDAPNYKPFGMVDDCNAMCADIKPIKDDGTHRDSMADVLEEFLILADATFNSGTYSIVNFLISLVIIQIQEL